MVSNITISGVLKQLSKDSKIIREHNIRALSGEESYITTIRAYDELLSRTDDSPVLIRAFLFAIEKHDGQWYQWKGKKQLPYSYHLCKCAIHTINFGAKKNQVIIALWHDIIEDRRATIKDIAAELKKTAYLGTDAKVILDAVLLLDKNGITSDKYFRKIVADRNVTLVKAADLAANLDACIARFDEMIRGKQRFWIYQYLAEIPELFLSKIKQKYVSEKITASISGKISTLYSSLPEKKRIEFENYVRRRNNGD